MKNARNYFILLVTVTICISWTIQSVAQSSKALELLDEMSDAIGELAAKVSPAIVKIVASGYVSSSNESVVSEQLLTVQRSGGSGVILDPNGYIVTNAHVVRGARSVQVQLPIPPEPDYDWSSIIKPNGKISGAQVVGIDLETDIAVLKVDEANLPFLTLGDSDNLRPGHMVLAFGSPNGLDNSVSIGVVSAVARQLNPEDPMIYIQTDAPINPGNSGGPLVDTKGQVVGINTIILSRSGGNEGLGFAGPSNIVRNVYEQIKKTGSVHRGGIGATAQTVTPLLAEGLHLPQEWGVVLSDVIPNSAADKDGLRVGDLVRSLNGKVMENARQFRVNVYQYPIGDPIRLDVIRDGQPLALETKVVERSDDPTRFELYVTPERNLISALGILGVELDRDIARLLPPLRYNTGVVVAARSQGSLLWEVGFEPGDVIYNINGELIASLDGIRRVVADLHPGDPVVAQVERDMKLHFVAFRVE